MLAGSGGEWAVTEQRRILVFAIALFSIVLMSASSARTQSDKFAEQDVSKFNTAKDEAHRYYVTCLGAVIGRMGTTVAKLKAGGITDHEASSQFVDEAIAAGACGEQAKSMTCAATVAAYACRFGGEASESCVEWRQERDELPTKP
jgi:hypothetical protein